MPLRINKATGKDYGRCEVLNSLVDSGVIASWEYVDGAFIIKAFNDHSAFRPLKGRQVDAFVAGVRLGQVRASQPFGQIV